MLEMATIVILNGAKMWISNSPFADIAVVWAKDEAGEVRGLVVERGYGRIYNS
jgi:glutaryl-CoA dehydrogenase